MAAIALQRLARTIAAHRILVSRIFAAVFFAVVLMTESLHEGNIVSSILFLSGLVLIGIATVGRLWCSLYISGYKDSQLITTGPYSICRNPLYFFSFLGFAGIGFATETVTLGLALSLIFLLGYRPVLDREEELLRSRFGLEFEGYCARTPRLIPDFAKFHEPDTYLVNPKLFRRTMGDVIWFVWFVGIIEFVEALHEFHYFEPFIRLP
jgi:protein-S-isoprenylcysteine O-methyltransferase Ste14